MMGGCRLFTEPHAVAAFAETCTISISGEAHFGRRRDYDQL